MHGRMARWRVAARCRRQLEGADRWHWVGGVDRWVLPAGAGVGHVAFGLAIWLSVWPRPNAVGAVGEQAGQLAGAGAARWPAVQHCPSPNQHITCLKSMYDPNRRIALTRFRTSCHDLRIERERYLPRAIQAPTHERTCLLCASPAIEDETHMVFHCPIHDHLRFEYADLFPPDLPTSIPCFLSQDQNRVASFINDCHVLRRRNACMSLAGSESAL